MPHVARQANSFPQNQLFQLRTIEQNELAVAAESNNKAILVFTVVTTIFLPLSFFTSYYGMNLKGVVDTEHGQGYFGLSARLSPPL